MLFEPEPKFQGLPVNAFQVFEIPDRERRRRAILESFHPALRDLGEDLLERVGPRAAEPLHAHLPRLDWPKGYQPFCTWLALSRERHGYQAGPQLNVGVHRDHVAVRLGWDTQADSFGRFEFLSRHADLGTEMARLAADHGLRFRVYAAAPWPEGSRRVFESEKDWAGAFDEVGRRGVWFQLGVRYDLPGDIRLVGSAELGRRAERVFLVLLPLYDRLASQHAAAPE